MIETEIIMFLMYQEGRLSKSSGRLLGWNIVHIRMQYGIPASTFYRSVNHLLGRGVIEKQGRARYVLSPNFRGLANGLKSKDNVRV